MKNVVYETINRKAHLVKDGEILLVKYRNFTGRMITMEKTSTNKLEAWAKWIDYNFVDKPQGVHCSPVPK